MKTKHLLQLGIKASIYFFKVENYHCTACILSA